MLHIKIVCTKKETLLKYNNDTKGKITFQTVDVSL